jgi:SM-20-related protein
LQEDFELLINGFLQSKVGIADHFLAENLSGHLRTNLLSLLKSNQLKPAGTGNAIQIKLDSKVRGDSIYWLDRKHKNDHEDAFFNLVEDFIRYLNMSCYAGINGCEFHYSIYEEGSFYTKHLDQFQNNEGRQYSLISYLNEDWIEIDGGELKIHQKNNDTIISPKRGKTVFFKSNELVHEVLLTNKRRMSITGWLKRN